MDNLQVKIKIVIVDDDVVVQDLIASYFKPHGYEVVTFSNAGQALAEYDNINSRWDIVVYNQQLPEMPGLQFIKTLKTSKPELPIIFLSAVNSGENASAAVHSGACDFFAKPIHMQQLHISIERAVYSSRFNKSSRESKPLNNNNDEGWASELLIGISEKMITTLNIAKKVATSDVSILISGESGSGKEVLANYIHAQSYRVKGPFIAINCSAIPENLLESELFGHAKGAFTGAIDKKIGLFEEAENGTLFLDEIGDLTPGLQAKLLRVLQEKKIKRIGENEYRIINARIISATHKNLAEEVEQNRFREDLFFRLNVIPVTLPSLKDRIEDILPLAELFLIKYTRLNNLAVKGFSEDAKQYLLENTWKGNVRELENSVERAAVLCMTETIVRSDFIVFDISDKQQSATITDLAETKTDAAIDVEIFKLNIDASLLPLQEVVQKYIEFAVSRNGGAKDRTAKEIGIDRKTLYRKMKSFEHYVQ